MTDGQDGYRDEREQGRRDRADQRDGDPSGSSSEPSDASGEAQQTQRRGQQQAREPRRRHRSMRAAGLGEPAGENLTEQANGQSSQGIAVGDSEPIPIDEYTTERRSLASLVQVQWAISAAIAAVFFGLITTAALTVVDVPPQAGALSILAFLALSLVWVAARYRVWTYQIREDSIYLERGVVTHVRTLVPYVRIQHVDTSRGPFERALGLSTLVVYTAGSRGADVSIPGLRPHEASDLQQRIKELAIEAEGDDAL